MHLTLLPHLATSSISIEALQKGTVKAHKDFSQLVFPGFVNQVTAWIKDAQEAPVMVGHLLIKFWIGCRRFDNIMAMYSYLDKLTWNHCQHFIANKGPVDAPIKVVYKEIFDPAIREGMTDEQVFAEIVKLNERDLQLARDVFSLRYQRNKEFEKIQQELGMELSAVQQHYYRAKQLLYLVLTNSPQS
jgi:DNA-directed RNA polymerase specialized sigma24 family protein